MNSVGQNLAFVKRSIEIACQKAKRNPSEVTLIAVSKTKPSQIIREAFEQKQFDFGENYVQEFNQKVSQLSDLKIKWHFIGHLQKRKVRDIVGQVALIHSVDSFDLASEINKRAEQKGIVQNCLLQVQQGDEGTKSGLNPNKISDVLKRTDLLSHIKISGLMALPPFNDDPEKVRPYFKALRELKDDLKLTELSMGMSHDFTVAIEEGATMVRVGSAVFGERQP